MFSITELNGMRETQEAHMMDTCVVYHMVSKVKNSRGVYEKTFGAGQVTHCGVQKEPLNEQFSGFKEADIDVILRLPLTVVVKPDDEIVITKRFGGLVKPQRYEVVRFENDGPSGCRAYLKARSVL